ncbi:MAG: PrsW family intramembrane metalloprotease [Candidatus Latescibacterota bacterium]|nr:MAG: PrsW family intramembrane metalloprotease [Candidatus Latescibacterota bacterium]
MSSDSLESSNLHTVISLAASLFPVITFLIVLVAIDSFKLVRFRSVLWAILYGTVIAFVCLWVSLGLLEAFNIRADVFKRYVAPLVEEILKATLVVYLVRRKRVGFMVDAAIFGFAVGTGFAIVENVYYFKYFATPDPLVWVVRGFGTAVMHGGVTSIIGITSKQLSDRYSAQLTKRNPLLCALVFLPGLLIAYAIHSVYNHFFFSPVLSTIGLLILLPLLMYIVFRASEKATRDWLGIKFDTDQELLEMIQTGRVTESRFGGYFESLQTRFSGEVVVDMLCMLRLHLELSIRAKGILLMREAGFKTPDEPEIEEKFKELKYLEKTIGKTGLMAAKPIFNMSDRDIWQLHMLGKK